MKNIVYKITSPSGKIYIGSTSNPNRRFKEYKIGKLTFQHKLKASFKKYGYENHKIEVLWEGYKSEMLNKETEYGLYYNVLDRNKGLNLKLPKKGDIKISFAEETIAKMKLARKGKPATWNNKIISSYDLKGNYIETLASIKQASKKYNILYQCIKGNLSGKAKSAGNYRFKYGNSTDNIGKLQQRITKYPLRVMRISKDNKIEVLNTVKDFVDKYSYLPANIYQCLNNKRKTAYGYKWKYQESIPSL